MNWASLRDVVQGFSLWLAVGWLIAIASLCWNVHQFRRARKTKVNVVVKCRTDSDPSAGHCRWLHVEVVNDGTELNDVHVTLDYPASDGKPHSHPMTAVGKAPNPFKFQFSAGFCVLNDDPSQPLDVLLKVPLSKTAIVVHSGIREVKRVPATKWRQDLLAFANSNPALPPKPAPPAKEPNPLFGWVDGYKGRW